MSRYRIAPRVMAVVVAVVLLAACTGLQEPDADVAAGAVSHVPLAAEAAAVRGATAVASGVTVTGTGRVSGQPDTLAATVGVEVAADAVSAALSGATQAADDLFAALIDAGVAEEDIQTANISLQPRYGEPPGPGEPVIQSYVATNLVRVTLRDIDSAGEVLQQAVSAAGEAAVIQQIGFELQDNAALLSEARAAAFADARMKAEQYATLADSELGELVGVTEGVSTPPPATSFATDAAAAQEAAGPIPVAPGQQEITVSVTATWALP